MKTSSLASALTLLVLAGLAVGQDQAEPEPMTLPPPREVGPAAPAPRGAWAIDRAGPEAAVVEEVGPPPAPGAVVFTGDVDYVLWFLGGSHHDEPIAANNVLGPTGGQVLGTLAAGEHGRRGPAPGARFALGVWDVRADPWFPGGVPDMGAEAVFFFVGQRSANVSVSSLPRIIRPFFDENHGVASGFVVATPGLATGGVIGHSRASVWGAEGNLWKNVYSDGPGTTCVINAMAGFRYLNLDSRLEIESVTSFDRDLAAFPTFLPFAGNTVTVFDSFATHNSFYGAQVGIGGKWWLMEKLFVEAGGKLAIGATCETLEIRGNQVRALPDGTRVVSPAGLLALPSNSGTFHRYKFAQVPELDLKVSAPLCPWLTVSTGFSALYWSRVLRPAEQIDRDIDITQIPNFPGAATATPTGLRQPGIPFKQSDLWVLGIHLGVELTW